MWPDKAKATLPVTARRASYFVGVDMHVGYVELSNGLAQSGAVETSVLLLLAG